MFQLIWTKYFLKAQGFKVEIQLLQDNKSSMLLEEKGMEFVGRCSQHINIRYFYIKDCLKKGHLTLEYRHTNDMLADMMTKLLQGIKFRQLRRMLLNQVD